MNLLRDGHRYASMRHVGIGNITEYDLEGDNLTIKIKLSEVGLEYINKLHYDKGDRIGDMNFETFNIHPEKWTLDRVFTLLTVSPLAEWATGKQGYKLYMNSLSGTKLYPHELQRDLSPQEYKKVVELINFSLKQSAPIFAKIYDLMHELGHMKHPEHKPLVEEQTESHNNNTEGI